MKENKTGLVIGILLILVLVLGGVVVYSNIIKPTINGYVTNYINTGTYRGINYTINTILNQLQQQNYVNISLGNNQTLILVPPALCPQIVQQQQAAQNANSTASNYSVK